MPTSLVAIARGILDAVRDLCQKKRSDNHARKRISLNRDIKRTILQYQHPERLSPSFGLLNERPQHNKMRFSSRADVSTTVEP